MKKSIFILMFALLALWLYLGIASAAGEKIKLEFPAGQEFGSGKSIILQVSLLDEQNSPLQAEVKIILENLAKTRKIEILENANKPISFSLGENETGGDWFATAKYIDIESQKEIFSIETKELAKFDIVEDKLIISNIGNVPYNKEVRVLIGDTIGIEKTGIPLGGKLTYRLIAPDGVYNVRVTDGKETFTKSDVSLTGEAVGVLDERLKPGSQITGVQLGEDSDKQFFNFIKRNTFAYVFLAIIVTAAILLAIERRYARQAGRYV